MAKRVETSLDLQQPLRRAQAALSLHPHRGLLTRGSVVVVASGKDCYFLTIPEGRRCALAKFRFSIFSGLLIAAGMSGFGVQTTTGLFSAAYAQEAQIDYDCTENCWDEADAADESPQDGGEMDTGEGSEPVGNENVGESESDERDPDQGVSGEEGTGESDGDGGDESQPSDPGDGGDESQPDDQGSGATEGSGSNTQTTGGGAPTADEIRDDIISAHASSRAAVGVPPLTWSGSLASHAQEWTNHLTAKGGCGLEHRKGATSQGYGENLFATSGTASAQDVVGSWDSEKSSFDAATNTCAPGAVCGHYTQVVWRNSTEVGCAASACKEGGQVWACNYNPAGNYTGEKPF